MKQIFTLFLVFTTLCLNAQERLETTPSLIGVTLGDNFSEWSNYISFEKSIGTYDLYNYRLTDRKTVFGYEINSIGMVFNKGKKLSALLISTNDLPSKDWDTNNFMPLVENLKKQYGKPNDAKSDENTGNISYRWESKNNFLEMRYNYKDMQLTLFLTSKEMLQSSENLK